MTGLELASAPRISEYEHGPELDAMLRKFGKYLVSLDSDAIRRYGVQLYHSHFPVAGDEAIVQRLDGKTLCTRVVPRSRVSGLTPTTWAFTCDGAPVVIQWSEDQVASDGVGPDLEQLGRFLAAEDLTSTFAIEILPYPLQAGPGEALLEDTDTQTRTQATTTVPRSEVTEWQAASWQFTSKGEPSAVKYCLDNDIRHNQPVEKPPSSPPNPGPPPMPPPAEPHTPKPKLSNQG